MSKWTTSGGIRRTIHTLSRNVASSIYAVLGNMPKQLDGLSKLQTVNCVLNGGLDVRRNAQVENDREGKMVLRRPLLAYSPEYSSCIMRCTSCRRTTGTRWCLPCSWRSPRSGSRAHPQYLNEGEEDKNHEPVRGSIPGRGPASSSREKY